MECRRKCHSFLDCHGNGVSDLCTGDTDFPDVLSATTPPQDQSPLRSWQVAGPFRADRSDSRGSCVPQQILPLRSHSWCHPTLLSLRRMSATLRRSLPLQGPPSGHSVAYRVSSPIPLLTTRLAATGVASSSIKSSSGNVKEVTRGERESSADALSCRSQCCLFLVPGPVLALLSPGQVSTILSPHVRVRCTLVALHGSRSLSRSFQRGWKSLCDRQCCGQTVNWESRSWTSSVHSQRSTVAHKLFFKTSACGQAAGEERL